METNLKLNEKSKKGNLFENIIDGLSIVILVAVLTDTILNFSELPNSTPILVAFNGDLTNFISGKAPILIFSLLSFVGLLICKFFSAKPNKLNYSVNITEANSEKQYSLASSFMKILGLEIVMLFSFLQFKVTNAILTGSNSIGTSYLIFSLLIILSISTYNFISKKF